MSNYFPTVLIIADDFLSSNK